MAGSGYSVDDILEEIRRKKQMKRRKRFFFVWNDGNDKEENGNCKDVEKEATGYTDVKNE